MKLSRIEQELYPFMLYKIGEAVLCSDGATGIIIGEN